MPPTCASPLLRQLLVETTPTLRQVLGRQSRGTGCWGPLRSIPIGDQFSSESSWPLSLEPTQDHDLAHPSGDSRKGDCINAVEKSSPSFPCPFHHTELPSLSFLFLTPQKMSSGVSC